MTRHSIQSTYDSRETGPQYHISTFVDKRLIGVLHDPMPDPFVCHTVFICRRDVLRAAIRRRGIKVSMRVGATAERVEDVCELDSDYLGLRDSTRRLTWNSHLNERLANLDDRPEASA